jgi:hypothetical protein
MSFEPLEMLKFPSDRLKSSSQFVVHREWCYDRRGLFCYFQDIPFMKTRKCRALNTKPVSA